MYKRSLAILSLLSLHCLTAATYTVTLTSDTVPVPAPGELRYGITEASSGDEIIFAPSLSGETITLTSENGPLNVTTTLSISNPLGTNPITISGGSAINVLYVSPGGNLSLGSGTATQTAIIITDGYLEGGAGGTTGFNTVGNGGGCGGGGGAMGAGLFIDNGGAVLLTNITFSNNSAQGGIGGGGTSPDLAQGGGPSNPSGNIGNTAGATGDIYGNGGGGAGAWGLGNGGGGAGADTTGTCGSCSPVAGGSGYSGRGGDGICGSDISDPQPPTGGGGGGGSNGCEGSFAPPVGFGGGAGGASSVNSGVIPGFAGGGNGGYDVSNAIYIPSGFPSNTGAGGNSGGFPSGDPQGPGGGGSAFGGAIFLAGGGTLTLADNVVFSGNTLTAGGVYAVDCNDYCPVAGAVEGVDLFLNSGTGTYLIFSPQNNMTFSSIIAEDDLNYSISGQGVLINTRNAETIVTFSAINTYPSTTILQNGILNVTSDSALGSSPATITGSGGTLQAIGVTTPRFIYLNENTTTTIDSAGSTTTLSGPIFDATTLGILNIIDSMTGGIVVLAYEGNSYTGGTIITSGTLQITDETNIGGSSAGFTMAGGILNITAGVTTSGNVSVTSSSTILSADTTTLSGVVTGSDETTLTLPSSGNVSLANICANSSDTFTVTGVIGGSQTLTKTGTGSVVLNGVNTYTANTIISTGTLSISDDDNLGVGSIQLDGGTLLTTATLSSSRDIALSNPSAVSVSTDVTTTLSGTITGNQTLTKEGPGTLILTGTNTSYTGSASVAEGILEIDSEDNIGGTGAGFTLAGGELSATNTLSFSGDIFVTASSTLSVADSDTITLSGTLTGSNGATLTSAGTGIYSLNTITVADSDTFTLAGPLGGSQGLNKTGAGTLTLNTVYDSTVGVILSEGILNIYNLDNIGSNALTLGGGTLQTLNSITMSQLVVVTGDTTLNTTSAYTTTLSGGLQGSNNTTLTLSGSGNSTIPTITVNGVDTFTVAGSMTGSQALTKSGDGILVLTGTNTYTGGTVVSAGTMSIQNENNIGGGSNTLTMEGGILEATGNVSLSSTISITGNSTITSSAITTCTGTLTGTDAVTLTLAGTGTNALSTISVNNSDTFTITGPVGGTLPLTKIGTGTLVLTGSSTYTGGTMISMGTLSIQSEDNIGGNSSNFTLEGGTLYTTNTVSTSGLVTITNPSIIQVEEFITTTLSGMITGSSSLTKAGAGMLILQGANTSYTGATLISDGILSLEEEGSIAFSNSIVISNGATFDVQTITESSISLPPISGEGILSLGGKTAGLSNSTFAGSITGTGGLNIQSGSVVLSGNNTCIGSSLVESGAILAINGTFTAPITVQSGGTLKGNGSIQNNVTLASGATISPGNSIGTLLLSNFTISSGSTSNFEIDPTSNSELFITETLTVEGPASISLTVDPGTYSSSKTYVLMAFNSQTGADLLSLTGSYPSLNHPQLELTSNSLLLILGGSPPSPTLSFPSPHSNHNAEAVAKTLTAISQDGLAEGNSSFTAMMTDLLALSTNEYDLALSQMQPSLFKGLSIAQESNAVRVEEALSKRLQIDLDRIHCYGFSQKKNTCQENKRFHFWAEGFGNVLTQHNTFFASSPQVGYRNNMAGGILGADANFAKVVYLGLLGAYTESNIHWTDHQGNGYIQTGYTGVYLSALGKTFYANASVMGDFSLYQASRKIVYTGVNAIASNDHGGIGLLAHLDTGLNLGWRGLSIRPFDNLDYIQQKEKGFTETGGGVYNLSVGKTHTQFFRNELGVNFAGCLCFTSSRWSLAPKVSWIREVRTGGKDYTAEFAGFNVPFVVTGYVPDRSLLGLGVLLSGQMCQDLLNLDLYYNGEFGSGYKNNSYGGGIRFGF